MGYRLTPYLFSEKIIMFLCLFEVSVSKDNKPFEYKDTKEFETTSELEAYKIVAEWSRRGSLKNSVNIMYRYDIIDKEIRHFTRENC